TFFDHQRGDRPGGISVASAWLLKYPANVGSWHIAAIRGNAALRSLSERDIGVAAGVAACTTRLPTLYHKPLFYGHFAGAVDHRHWRLLRARRERPCGYRAAEQRDELSAFHYSITSSARASSMGGISRPIARAVGRLMMKSNLVDCTTGRS